MSVIIFANATLMAVITEQSILSHVAGTSGVTFAFVKNV